MIHLTSASRQLAQRPGISLVTILMLALGIGITTAIFSSFYEVLVRPLPVPDPDGLVNVSWAGPERSGGEAFSYRMFRDLEDEQSVFTGLAAQSFFSANLALGDRPLRVDAVAASGSYFQTLGVQPELGRLIGPQDEPRVDESAVVVLSHGLWQSRFGGDPDIMGRTLSVNGHELTVIGVVPEGFTGTQVGVRAQLFVPLTMRWQLDPSMPRAAVDNRLFNVMFLFARLRPDVTPEQASTRINSTYGRLLLDVEAPIVGVPDSELERFADRRLELSAGARGRGVIAGAPQALTLLLGVTLLVLLIVCVNVINLLLARGASRTGEIAIRESLGASRGRLLAQLMTETAVPAVLGGVLSLPVAALTLGVIGSILPASLRDALSMRVDGQAVLFAALATLSITVVVGLLPALRTTRTSPAAAIKAHAAQTLGGYKAARVRGALVTAQIAFSLVLLVLAGLFAKSLLNVARIDLGLDVDSLVAFSVSPRLNGYDPETTAALYARIEEQLAAQPGVTDVAYAAVPLISGSSFESQYFVDGRDREAPSVANFNLIGPSFFRALSIPMLAGREFAPADASGQPRVTIVNERLAREHGLAEDAVGEYVTFGPGAPRMEIVGVAADAVYGDVKGGHLPVFFVPHRPGGYENPIFDFVAGSLSFYVRTGTDPDTLLRAIPGVVAGIDPALPVSDLTTMRNQTREQVFVDRLVTVLSVSFAGVATLLAAVGLYGVLAYNMTQRIRELGLRLALGAAPRDLRVMVFRQVGVLASIGIAVGLAGAIGAGRVAQALLYGLSGNDPAVLVAAAAGLAAVVLVASYLPARRASNVAPIEALRHE